MHFPDFRVVFIMSVKINNLLIITNTDRRGNTVTTVFLKYIPIVHFNTDSDAERKLAVIELVEQNVCNQTIAGKICGFHRNTVFKLVRTKKLLGVEEVLKDDRGQKGAYKYIGEIRSHIKKLLRKYPGWSDREIAEQAVIDLKMDISRSAVARIRTEKQEKGKKIPPQKELIDMAELALEVEEEHKERLQLWFNFDEEPELKEKADEVRCEPGPKATGKAQHNLINELEAGKICSFAGGFMHHLFLGEINFRELTSPFPFIPGATYQSSDILATIFHSIAQGVPSIEALKLLNAGELGLLTGLSRIPDKAVLRDHLAKMAKHALSGELIDGFARILLDQGRIDREVFFIDGHFLPYYGLNVIAKGYFTVRRLAMRGNELYVITDIQGRPLFFITESNEIDFRPIILRAVNSIKDLGIDRPVLVFDRGGYGVHSFTEIDEHADFVTWAMHLTNKFLAEIDDKHFKSCLAFGDDKFLLAEIPYTVKESAQTAKRAGRKDRSELDVRLVVFHDINTGKRLGVFTNNQGKSTGDIAFYMLNRWGKSENHYKEMMAKYYLDYHPGYDIKELENQPLVDNPDVALTKMGVNKLKKEITEIENEIKIIEAEIILNGTKKRLEKSKIKFQDSLEEAKKDLRLLGEKLLELPDKVSILNLLKGKAMCRCDLEKKKLYDLMQFMLFHSNERLLDIFRNCYDDHRDIKPVLNMITKSDGVVKLVGNTLMVLLRWIENKKHREAAQKLCVELNKKGISLVGRLNVKLSFHVARVP